MNLAGYPNGGRPTATADLRAQSLYSALRDRDTQGASLIFDLIAAAHGTPSWEAAQQDGVPGCIWALVSLIAGRKKETVEGTLRDFLQPDRPGGALSMAHRHWAPLIARLSELNPRVRARVAAFAPETRLLFDAALADAVSDPTQFQHAWAIWSPLLRRLFPRLPT